MPKSLSIALLLVASPALAEPVCRMDPAVRTQLDVAAPPLESAMTTTADRNAHVASLTTFASKRPNDLLVQATLLDARSGAADGARANAAILAEYDQRAKARPTDAQAQYLYALALADQDKPEADAAFVAALKLDPSLAFANLELAHLRSRKHGADALVAAKAYAAACPNEIEGQALVAELSPVAQRPPLLKALHATLAKSTDPRELTFYNSLWRSMFADSKRAQQPALRAQVSADVKRLQSLPPTASLVSTIAQGAKLADDEAALKAAHELALTTFPTSWVAIAASQNACKLDEAPPGSRAPIETIRKHYRALYAATEPCVTRWPKMAMGWLRRLQAASELPELPLADVQQIADKVLTLTKNTAFDDSVTVATLYLDRETRLDAATKILDEKRVSLDTDAQGTTPMTERDRAQADEQLVERWEVQSELVRAYALSKQGAACEKAVHQLEALDAVKRAQDDPEAKQDRQTDLLVAHARLDAVQNRLADSVASLLRAYRQTSGTEERLQLQTEMQRSWKTLGGKPETLALITSAPAQVAGAELYKAPHQQLPAFDLKDVDGKTWSLAKLKGKIVVVSAWATWCGPCKLELPLVQALYDKVRAKKDVVLLSFNVDSNPGLIDPFLKEHKLTFPVVPAVEYFEANVPDGAIPHAWIFDGKGVLVREAVGFDPDAPFVEQTLREIDAVKRAK